MIITTRLYLKQRDVHLMHSMLKDKVKVKPPLLISKDRALQVSELQIMTKMSSKLEPSENLRLNSLKTKFLNSTH